ncbi:nectin-2-like isoform X2 [Chiloscyllium plagiosum]|uniref:nectin-2-like isoform X2 n=1 Tax=Chiloscyllium plagiosum TaxID=36176 RepID=UPI001CB845DA|nr:nectin-2-like isoform X2 [Chiloscyllium plagiosum]
MATLYLIPFVLLLQTWTVCDAQNVKVEPFIYGYVGNQAILRCQFVDPDNSLQVTQITWMKNPTTSKVNLAVYNPDFGINYPTDTGGRIHFRKVTNTDATLIIDRLEMADDGIYSCEFATYPDGNQDATTNLTILAKPENSGKTILVQAGHAEVPVARCVSANGKPPATINWSGGSEGNVSETVTKNNNGTFTVTSEYLMIPTGDNNGEKLTCVVMQQALDRPETIPITLSVQYAPIVSIEGYDENWYLDREHASLTCSAKANPQTLNYKWLLNGKPLPSSIQVDGHQLTVRDVSYIVNGTFTCEVTNSLGTGRAKMDVVVREDPVDSGSTTGAIVGGIIAAIVILTVLVTAVLIFKRQRKNTDEEEDDLEPPNYKPPPPKKTLEGIDKVMKTEDEKMESIPITTTYFETGAEEDNGMTLTQYYDEPGLNTEVKSANIAVRPGDYLEQENPIYNDLSYNEPEEHRKSQEFVSKGMYV